MKIKAELVDVHGSLRRLVVMGPKTIRTVAKPSMVVSAHAVAARMKALAPVGADAPHIRDDIEIAVHPTRLFCDVGYFSNPDQAAVAMYNEYSPNHQPFMRPALEAEENDFHARFVKSLKAAAAALSVEP